MYKVNFQLNKINFSLSLESTLVLYLSVICGSAICTFYINVMAFKNENFIRLVSSLLLSKKIDDVLNLITNINECQFNSLLLNTTYQS